MLEGSHAAVTSAVEHARPVASALPRGTAFRHAPIALAAAVVAAIYLVSPNFRWSETQAGGPYAGDFLQEWIGGHVVGAGEGDRLYAPAHARALEHDPALVGFRWDERQYLPMVYPPFYYVLVRPLALLSVPAAAAVWGVLMIAALAVAAGLAWRRLTAARDSAWTAWLLPAAVLFAPLLESLSSSQKGTLALAILAGTFCLLEARRPLAAGLVCGLLLFKPQLLIVIGPAMLACRQWRFTAGLATTCLALAALSLVAGIKACADWLRFVLGTADYLHNAGYDLHKSHCLYGFFELLLGSFGAPVVRGATLAAAGGVVFLLWRILRGGVVPGTPRFAGQFAALVAATVLLSPHLFTYDLTILLLPMFLLLEPMWREGARIGGANRMAAAAVVAVYAVAGLSPAVAALTGWQLSVPLIAGLLVASRRRVLAGPG
jgi:hypothetical protein